MITDKIAGNENQFDVIILPKRNNTLLDKPVVRPSRPRGRPRREPVNEATVSGATDELESNEQNGDLLESFTPVFVQTFF